MGGARGGGCLSTTIDLESNLAALRSDGAPKEKSTVAVQTCKFCGRSGDRVRNNEQDAPDFWAQFFQLPSDRSPGHGCESRTASPPSRSSAPPSCRRCSRSNGSRTGDACARIGGSSISSYSSISARSASAPKARPQCSRSVGACVSRRRARRFHAVPSDLSTAASMMCATFSRAAATAAPARSTPPSKAAPNHRDSSLF